MSHGLFVSLLLLVTCPALCTAQSECLDTAGTQADLTKCSDEAFKAADRQLQQLIAELGDSLPVAQRARLDSAQGAWTAYAAAQCRLEGSPYEGGSMYSMQVTLCRRDLAEQRIDELAPLLCATGAPSGQPCPAARRYARPHPRAQGGLPRPTQQLWFLADSTRLESRVYGYAYRIVVGVKKADTIARVVPPFPVVLGDSLLIGLRFQPQGDSVQFFRYHVGSGQLDQLPLPVDARFGYHDICLSPHGKYVAYEAFDTNTHKVFAAVREWPNGALVVRGPDLQAYPSDGDFDHARWLDDDQFQIVVAEDDDYLWVLHSGRVSTRRYAIQKLDTEPHWHERGGNYCPGS